MYYWKLSLLTSANPETLFTNYIIINATNTQSKRITKLFNISCIGNCITLEFYLTTGSCSFVIDI